MEISLSYQGNLTALQMGAWEATGGERLGDESAFSQTSGCHLGFLYTSWTLSLILGYSWSLYFLLPTFLALFFNKSSLERRSTSCH